SASCHCQAASVPQMCRDLFNGGTTRCHAGTHPSLDFVTYRWRRKFGAPCIEGWLGCVFQTQLYHLSSLMVEEFTNQGECKINARSDTASRDDISVFDDPGIIRCCPEQRQLITPGPVAGRTFASQQACGCKNEGTGTD